METDSGIIVAQYGSDDEDKLKYQIVQVKDDELRLLKKEKEIDRHISRQN